MRYSFRQAGENMRMKLFKVPYLLLMLGAGCSTVQKPPEIKPAAVEQKVDLNSVVALSVKKSADIRVIEALQIIAREHVEKSRLLELPGMINDLPRRLPELTVGNDYRLHILDHALESGRILTRPAHEDLQKIQLAVEKKKIAYEQAVRFSTLDYAGRLQRAGINSASIKAMQKDAVLELEISSGLPEKMIKNFDYSCLPEPFPLQFPEQPQYVKDILKFYGNSPDSALRFADMIYRLPSELLHRKDSNFNAAFELALAAGTAVKLELVKQYADNAFKKYRKSVEKLNSSPEKSPALLSAAEQARLEWRTAFFRMKYDLHPYPENPDKNELQFLKDMLSLQEK